MGANGFLAECRFHSRLRGIGESSSGRAIPQTRRSSGQRDSGEEDIAMMRRTLLAFISVSLLCATALSQQSPSAFLQGTVIEVGTDMPIGKATVELRPGSGTGTPIAVTRTDSEGKFYLPNTTPGTYRIRVTHAGHVTALYGQRQPGGPGGTLTVPPGQRTDVRVAMTPGGVISGRITDKGQPIGLADVFVVKAIYTEGQLPFNPVLAVRVDDTGEFHLFWLPPGRYYLIGLVWDQASSIGYITNPDGVDTNGFFLQRFTGRAVFMRATAGGLAPDEAHVPIYYPGTPDPQLARVIDVQPGAVLRGLDIDASALPTRKVRGRVVGLPAGVATPRGQPLATVSMRPLTAALLTNGAQAPDAAVDSAGNFEINKATPGRYVLMASGGGMTARTLVEVRERDVSDIVLTLSSGFNLSGRITSDRGTAPSGLRVILRPDPILPNTANFNVTPQADGSFTFPASIGAGDYRVYVGPILVPPSPVQTPPAPPAALKNVYIKSIRFGDADVLNDGLHLESQPREPLTIVVGTNPGTIEGRVVNDRQQALPATTVVLVHSGGLRSHVNEMFMSSDAAGRFEFQNVPPGNYEMFAWDSVETGAWQDPEFMRSFENRGTAVRITEGGKTSVDVKMIEK
jgi:hypothetical protein